MPARLDGMCKNGLHRLSEPGARNANGVCRVCWNKYSSEYSKKQREKNKLAKQQLNEILAILGDQNLTAEV